MQKIITEDDTDILELYADCALKNEAKISCFEVLEKEKVVRFPKGEGR